MHQLQRIPPWNEICSVSITPIDLIQFSSVELHTRTRPQLMYGWCFFHNQMFIIHHHNWHLWYYNRFLLINWCMAHMKRVMLKYARQRNQRSNQPKSRRSILVATVSSSTTSQDENHTVIFFMATYTTAVAISYWIRSTTHGIHKLKLALEQLWNMRAPCIGFVMLHY